MRKTNNITLSFHAMDSFSLRTRTTMIKTPDKMRELLATSSEISREEVMNIVKDDNIKKLINKKSKYFICDLEQEHKGVFVIRDNTCVTFKTTMEKNIWESLSKC